jgi:type I restriction enzyme, S subunit
MTQKQLLFNAPVPKGWQVITVNEIKANEPYSCVAGPFGSNISSKYFVDAGIPVIRGGNLTVDSTQFVPHNFVFVSEDKAKSFKAQHVKAGDLVFTCWGTLGQVGLIPNNSPYPEYIISNKQLKLRPNKEISDERFLYYYFATPQMVQYIRDISIGAAVPGINLGLLKAIKIVLPPLPIQKKIVAIISAYDDLIENNDRRIILLEKMAEEIYREWFVRLRFPGHDRATFHKGIPEGWEVKKIRELVKYYIGGGWGNEIISAEFGMGAFVIRGTDLPHLENGNYPNEIFRFHKQSNYKSRKIEAGDIIFEVSGGSKDQLLGRSCLMTEKILTFYSNNAMCASFCKLIRINKDLISPYFMKYFLKLYYSSGCVGTYQVQSTGISNYQFEDFLSYQTLITPPLMLIREFDKHILPILNQKDLLALSNLSLKQTRDRLLTRLISGKLSVEDLDIQFPPSMTTDS